MLLDMKRDSGCFYISEGSSEVQLLPFYFALNSLLIFLFLTTLIYLIFYFLIPFEK